MNEEVRMVAVNVWVVLALLRGLAAVVVVAWILLRSRA